MSTNYQPNLSRYVYFEDGDPRRYQPRGLRHPDNLGNKKKNPSEVPRKYSLSDGSEFFYDPVWFRVNCSSHKMYAQLLQKTGREQFEYRLLVSIAGTKIQFGTVNSKGILLDPIGDHNLPFRWHISEIGAPLLDNTVWDDQKIKLERPRNERTLCLTNASQFRSKKQQAVAVHFVEMIFQKYGNPYGSFPAFGRETRPGEVIFSSSLVDQLSAGDAY